jgi:hypothetical protein
VLRHTKGIGILRALEWTRWQVFRQYLGESALIVASRARRIAASAFRRMRSL